MEKRLFLAIGLSLLVVWLWSVGNPQKPTTTNMSEVSVAEDVTGDIQENQASFPLLGAEKSSLERVAVESAEETTALDSDKLTIEVSNLGAGISKVTIKEYDVSPPLEKITSIADYENAPFSLVRSDRGELVYRYEDENFNITKTYTIEEGDYIIEAKTNIQNKTDMSKLVSPKVSSYLMEMSNLEGKDEKLDRTKARDKSLNEYVVNAENGMHRKGGAFKFSSKERKEELGRVFWSGFRNRYFCVIIKPQYDTKGYTVDPVGEKRLKVEIEAQETEIPPHGNVQFDSIVYVGPEKTEVLGTYGFGFEKIKKYYRFILFDSIALIIAGLMRMIHKVIPNWGVCIMLISVIIYFSMYPLTMRGMLSMKKMQGLQPLIAKLKEKHKDSPQKMNKEMMELYKEHKVNPLGGCLPMLLQMPVFIGLYQVLWRSVSFKGAKFLWIKDLSEPDRLFMLPFDLPILGNELNVLPLVMVVVMFFQQKLSAKNMVTSDPSQVAQQKMMMTIMPVFLGFIFYKFASGLTLYFTMFYFFSTFTQWKMSKQAKVS